MPMQHLRFGRAKLKSPPELVSRVNGALANLVDKNERTTEKAMEDVSRFLEQIKVIVLGMDDQPPNKEQALLLAQEAVEHNLVKNLLNYLKQLEFETRKDVGLVVGALLRIKTENVYPMAEYFWRNEGLIYTLVDAYSDCGDPHITLVSGGILRDCIKHEKLAKVIAESTCLLQFFEDIGKIKFEIAADAFATFRELIVRHRTMIAQVLLDRFDEFFPKMNALIQTDNFFIKRQSLKLLAEILLAPENVQVTAKYVQDVQNLIMCMNLLRDKYDSIQFEAFHAFKVFLIGEDKAPEVLSILRTNKEKLIRFFDNFHNDKEETDEDFRDEKAYVRELITKIPDPVV